MRRISTIVLAVALQSTATGAAVTGSPTEARDPPYASLAGPVITPWGQAGSDATGIAGAGPWSAHGLAPTDRPQAAVTESPAGPQPDSIAVPLPPAAWLFGAAIFAFAGMATRNSR